MSQQDMEFEGIMRDDPQSSSTGYRGVPHYKDYTANSYGQKVVSGRSNAPSAGHRLALAIVSLSLLLVMLLTSMLAAAHLPWSDSPGVAYTGLFTIIFMSALFAVATMVINYFFNRRS
ncbi:MAG TPA: hypothetical protein VFB60_25175 [Ktedonobacteraceae bacterium]|nr:hypothetical protein [Ktedonobacteraceae bacterium]